LAKKLFIAIMAVLINMAVLTAQVEHPQRVRIKPTTPQADALRVWGGIKAGLDGNVTVVDINGALVTGGSIGGGTETDPGVAPADDPDTGWFWPAANQIALALGGVERVRFDTIGRMGLGTTTPARQIHISEASAQAGIRITRGDGESWDFTVDDNLNFVHVGGSTALTLTPTNIGVFDTTPDPSYVIDANGAVKITGNLRVDSFIENSLIPNVNDLYSIGSTTRAWKEAWITQLNTVIFAENTVQITGGWQIIGKNTGTFATAVASAAATIDLGKTIGSVPQFLLVKAHDAAGVIKTEYIRLDSLAGGTTYNVTRDITALHGTDPDWADGTAWLLLGQQGDGRIQLYASSGLAQISVLRQGATANAQDTLVQIGGLDGMPTMSSQTGRYGIFIGQDANSYLKYQKQPSGAASGDDEKLIVQGTIQATAGWFGDGSNDVQVDSTGLNVGSTGAIRGGATSYASGTGFWFGFDAGAYKGRIGTAAANRITFDSGTGVLTIAGNGSGITSINGGNITTGTVTATQISVSQLSAISADLGTITAGTVTGAVLQTATSGARVVIDSSNGLRGFNSGGTLQVQISNATGKLTAGAGAVTLDSSGIFVTPVINTGFVGSSSYRFIDLTSSREPGLYYTTTDTLERQLFLHFSSAPTLSGRHAGGITTGNATLYLEETASTSQVFTSAAALNVGGIFRIYNSDSTTSLGSPWIRSNGNYLVINPDTGSSLYLAWDAGVSIYAGADILPSSTSIDIGSSVNKFGDIWFSEPTTTTDLLYPLVTNAGRIMALSDGYTGSCAGTVVVELGIVKGCV
jgi:hypothetical protein